jgi:hypothetical protein
MATICSSRSRSTRSTVTVTPSTVVSKGISASRGRSGVPNWPRIVTSSAGATASRVSFSAPQAARPYDGARPEWRPAIADLDPGAAETSAELTAEDGTVIGLGTDVTERPQIRAAVGSRDRAARATDLLVNCAGVDGFEPFLKISDESWNRIIAVNLTGTFAFCQEVVPHILDARWGRIVGA